MTFEENLKTIAGYGYEELAEDLDGCYFDSTGKMEIVIEELLKRVMEMEEDHDFGA